MAFYFIALSFVLYGNSISNNYSLDDELVTRLNGETPKGIESIPEIFASHYIKHYDNGEQFGYRPIVVSSFAIEYSLFGENPQISHLINILIYAFTCIFLFLLLEKLFINYHIVVPFLVTTLFLVHPAHTEVVDSLKNRDALLSFFGVIVSLYFFIKYAEVGKMISLLMGLFLFFFAMLSKEDVIPFLVIIPVTIFFFTNANRKKLILVTLGIAISIILFYKGQHFLFRNEHGLRHYIYFENPLYYNKHLLLRIGAGCVSLFFYLKLLCFPKTLLAYYGYNQIDVLHPNMLVVCVSTAVSLIAFVYIVKNFRKKNILTFGILYFFISISMFLNVLVPAAGIVADRFVYEASLGFCILLSIGLLRVFKVPYKIRESKIGTWKIIFFGVVSLLIIVFSTRVIARNPDWKNHFTLYEHDVKEAENSAKLNALYAAACMAEAKKTTDNTIKTQWVKEGMFHYEKAIDIFPKYASALHNLALAYVMYNRDYTKAIELMKETIACDSTYVEAYFNIGSCYQVQKNYGEAEKYYLKAIALKPKFANPYSNLSMIYCSRKQYQKAVDLNDTAISRGLKSEMPYIDIGNVYIYESDTTKAMKEYDTAMAVNPKNKALCYFLVRYYQRTNDTIKYNKYNSLLQKEQSEKQTPPSLISE